MIKELEEVKDLLDWPVHSKMLDIQPHFSSWYEGARVRCRTLSLSSQVAKPDDKTTQTPTTPCSCHAPSPYKGDELWSLQNAIDFACRLHLDKSCRLGNWSSRLTSQSMIRYACHDTLAVTFLIRPIMEKWTFEMIMKRKKNEIFVGFKSKDLDNESESSDDEIFLDELIEPSAVGNYREAQKTK